MSLAVKMLQGVDPHAEEVVDQLDLIRDRKSTFDKVVQKSVMQDMMMQGLFLKTDEAERTIADNEQRVRRPWTSSDLGTSGSQTMGPYLWAQHCAPAKGFLSEECSVLHEEVALRDLSWEIRGLLSQCPAVMQTPLDVQGWT
jgi:hypothetical protein